MPKTYKWGSFSLAELRKVAKSYKDHTKVSAVSKMSKKDLIVLLDKHLILDKDTAEIKIRESMETSLGEVERLPKKSKKKMEDIMDTTDIPVEREEVKEMTTAEHIQALPQELQDKIYKFLPANLRSEVEEGSYTKLIDLKIMKMEDFIKKIKTEKEKFEKLYSKKGTNEKEQKSIEKTKEKLLEELKNLDKQGRDKTGNIYYKQADTYFTEKYGENYFNFHPTAPKDKYWNIIDKITDLNDKAKKLIKEIKEYY